MVKLEFMSAGDLAEQTGSSRATIIRRIHAGQIKASRLFGRGSRWRIPLKEAEKFIVLVQSLKNNVEATKDHLVDALKSVGE